MELEPLSSSIEECACDLLGVDTLVEPEKADTVVVRAVVVVVDDCSDASEWSRSIFCQEECDFTVLVEWVTADVEQLHSIENQWRHPPRVALVEAPLRFDEAESIAATVLIEPKEVHRALRTSGTYATAPASPGETPTASAGGRDFARDLQLPETVRQDSGAIRCRVHSRSKDRA